MVIHEVVKEKWGQPKKRMGGSGRQHPDNQHPDSGAHIYFLVEEFVTSDEENRQAAMLCVRRLRQPGVARGTVNEQRGNASAWSKVTLRAARVWRTLCKKK